MEHLILDKNSLHFIKYFKNYEELAFLSVPYLAETKVAISGGNTYKKLFEYWKYYKNRLKNTEFFPVDERKVPFNSEDSNWGAAYRNFLSKINRDSDKGNYTQSAVEYTELLKESFGAYDIIFNAVFLGVGDDGHTASLFPGTEHVDDLTNPVIETLSPIPPFERITLGSRVITAAEHLIVIVEGENKREVFRRILENDCTLPVVRILSRYNNGIIFVNNKLKHLYTKI